MKGQSRVAPYLYILPALLVYGVFVLLPVAMSMGLSLTNYNLQNIKFVGLNNYARLLRDNIFHHALVNTLLYSFLVVAVNLILGLVIAVVLNERWFRGSKLCRSLFYIPYIISPIASSMIWLYLYEPRVGVLNAILRGVGIAPKDWLLDEHLAMPSIIVMAIWQGMGYCMVVCFSGIQGVPRYLYEAAEIDGAGKVVQFFRITLPMLSPTIFFLIVMTMIASFQVFAQIIVMTSGGPLNSTTTIAHQIYLNAFVNYNMAYASSMAVVLFLIVLIITLLFFRYGNREGDTELD